MENMEKTIEICTGSGNFQHNRSFKFTFEFLTSYVRDVNVSLDSRFVSFWQDEIDREIVSFEVTVSYGYGKIERLEKFYVLVDESVYRISMDNDIEAEIVKNDDLIGRVFYWTENNPNLNPVLVLNEDEHKKFWDDFIALDDDMGRQGRWITCA